MLEGEGAGSLHWGVSLRPWCFCVLGCDPATAPAGAEPSMVVVASCSEEVVTGAGRAGRGSGKGRGGRQGEEAGCSWGPGGCGAAGAAASEGLSTPRCCQQGREKILGRASSSFPPSQPSPFLRRTHLPLPHSSFSSPFSLLSPLLHFFPSFSPIASFFIFLLIGYTRPRIQALRLKG